MIRSEKIGLRARHEADVPVLQAELYEDVAARSRVQRRPWLPRPAGSSESPFAVPATVSDNVAVFSAVELSSGELAGDAVLYGIDAHHRVGYLGLSLRPAFRGRGLGADIVRALCRYGFSVRGLNRLQVETLADNAAMIAAATRVGFAVEGRLRQSAWVCGEFIDEVVLGLLAEDWVP